MKNIVILAVVTVVLVIIAAQLSGTRSTSKESQAGTAFFPDLSEELKHVDSIRIQTASEYFTVNKVDGIWGLASSYHYPVAIDKVSKILNGMASFVLLEKKTANPELHERLELKDVTEADSKATLLELKRADNTVAALLLGKTQTAKSDNTRTEVYVRKPNEEQTWLVMGTLNFFSQSAKEWLERTISDIDSQRIRQVVITRKAADTVKVFKETEQESHYQLAELPAEAEITEMYKLNNLAGSLEGLNLDDVMPSENFEFSDDAAQVVFNTFDGLEVAVKAMEKEGVYYLHLMATAKPETAVPIEVEKSAETTEDEEVKETAEQRDLRVAKEADAFNQKVAAWVYMIPEYKYNNLLPNKADLFKLKEVKAEEEKQEESSLESLEPLLPKEGAPVMPEAKSDVQSREEEATAPLANEKAKMDFAQMLKQAAERAKNNPQPQDALANPMTVQNLQGESINLPDLFRQAVERAKKQSEAQDTQTPE